MKNFEFPKHLIRPSAAFISSSDVGQGFSLAPPPEYIHEDSNPKGLFYRIEIPIHLIMPSATFVTVIARRTLPLHN